MDNRLEDTFCPACKGKSNHCIDWEMSGLNDSIFNYVAEFYECGDCGLVYNTNMSDEKLAVFYAGECSYFEKPHFNIDSAENIQKYACYKKIISDAGLSGSPIADIGCGRGGFLIWLKKNGWKSICSGVDIDRRSFADAMDREGLAFEEGRAVQIPFSDESCSLLTYFHVIEHIVTIEKVFQEANRVLRPGGHIMIEVPDADRYREYPVGTAFWLSIREHVYHYSADSLKNILSRNGFEVIGIHRNILPTPEFSYPSLIILARKNPLSVKPEKSGQGLIAPFVLQSKRDLEAQAKEVMDFCAKYKTAAFWGLSAELFSLLPLLKLETITLCDSSKDKQKARYKGIPIHAPENLKKDAALIIAPYLFSEVIKAEALKLGWQEKAIYCLR